MSISVLILSKNEERDLPDCLTSVAWCDDIHLFDSMSTDKTVEIAQSFGVHITQRSYGDNKLSFGGDESAHRNWGLKNINFKYDWVFVIDADERMTQSLVTNIRQAVANAGDVVAFSVQRRDFFLDTWLKHVQASPFYLRLLRPSKVHYERVINPITVPEGKVSSVSGYLDHFPFSKGIHFWMERHNAYSRAEALQIISNRQTHEKFSLKKVFFEKDFHIRRFHQKEFFYRLPLRPVVKFCILYFMKFGFLDKRAGLTYAILQTIYEYLIVLKVNELEKCSDSIRK